MRDKSLQGKFKSKLRTADEAVRMIRSGQRVFIGSSCGEPQHLVNALLDNANFFSDVEIVRLLSLEGSVMSLMADEHRGHKFHVRSIYQGSDQTKNLRANKRFITPLNLCAVPDLFKKKMLPLHFALIQVSPPDDNGWMSLGISVHVTLAAARSAAVVIAQVNSMMPRTPGHSFIHLDDASVIVEQEEELLSAFDLPAYESASEIAAITANLIDDGATIQLGLAELSPSIAKALAQKTDLGVHTEILTDDLMELVSRGVVTNRHKTLNEGKVIASGAIGSQELYRSLHNNVVIEFRPSDYVNNPAIIAQNSKMVAINFARTMDLSGQVYADALPHNHFSGVTGMFDFILGTSMSPGGKSIMVIPARSIDGKTSRIIPKADGGAIVIPKGYVSYVVSEFGMVNLLGKNIEERAMAMIVDGRVRADLSTRKVEITSQNHNFAIREDSLAGKPVVDLLVEVTEAVSVGDLVFSAAARGILPDPLLYGRITRVERPTGAAHWEIWMEPAVAHLVPETVAVLRAELSPLRVAESQ